MGRVRNADRTLEWYNTAEKEADRAAGSSTDTILWKTAHQNDQQEDSFCKPFTRPLDNDPMSALRLNGHLSSEYSGLYAVSEALKPSLGGYSEEQFDPSRMFQSQFLSDDECRNAIISELNGLAAPDSDGISPLKLAHQLDEAARGKRKILSTMVVLRKSTTEIEARLCLRGDILVNFDPTCSPTPYRSALR